MRHPVTVPPSDRRDASGLFALFAVGAAGLLAAVALVLSVTGASNDGLTAADTRGAQPSGEVVDFDDGAIADRAALPADIIADAAAAMAEVGSVEFTLDRSGAPIYIDQFASIALDDMIGQFTVPTKAQAQLTVTVNGDLTTRLGAVAVDDEVWISNPVTGDFETLPDGYDIDPSRFFDPEGGWQPLLANLRDVELVAIDDRGGERYHLRGTAPAAEVRNITVGLVRDQDVPVNLWIHPGTSLVTHAEFDTMIDDAQSQWALTLDRYGETFAIEPPANVRAGD